MTDTFHASKPIYIQLAERIQRQILRGELAPGDKLPSVREMGIQSSVNPNTVQRTYRELEGMNIVETKRGQGSFVTE
ncbi:GntR family transcriptional regulator, partial [Flavobacterium sp. IR1]